MNSRRGKNVVFERIKSLYSCLDAELESLGLACRVCGRCCNFLRLQEILYASSLEVDYLVENSGPPPAPEKEGNCPYLRGNLCSAHPFRTLGCRTFFCEGLPKEVMQEIYHRYYGELKLIAEEFGWPWLYAPFLEQLGNRRAASSPLSLADDFP